MKYIYLTIITLLTTAFVFAQESSITGKVTNLKTGEPIPGASVYLKNNKNTITDFDGNYSFDNLSGGNYNLFISFIGFESVNEEIIVTANKNIIKNYTLEEAVLELQDVEIVGRKRTSYKPDVTYAGAKVAVDIKDVPQSIAIVNKEVIKDQGLFRLNEVTANIAGVTRTRAESEFTSRGFRIQHDFINGNRALFSSGFSSSSIATQYERIEFIKGPAAATFGNSSPGGVVNAVTKKPLKENRAYASVSAGGFEDVDDVAKRRATLDITGPLNDDKTLLYRTNVAWESSDNFIDFQKKRSFLFAPSISYLPTDKTRINIDLVGSFSNDDSGINRGIPVLQNDLFALPISFTATEPFDNRQGSNTILTTSASHKFSDFLTLNASYTRSDLNEDFIETRSNNDFTADGTELIRLINDRITEGSSDFITAYLVGNFKTGAVKHKALLGLDYYEENQISTTRIAIGEVNGVPNLSFGNRQPVASISELDDLNFDPASTNEFILGSLHRGFYIQDLFEVGKFKILAALRYEELKNRTGGIGTDVNDAIEDGVLLPRLGITYSLNDNVNIYASYTEGFELIEIPNILTTVTAGEEFDPFESDQIEVGTKINLFKDKLLTQLSLYHINRSGRLLADSSGGAVVGFQLGEETSRGVEIELTGNVTNNISLTANYAFNETEINESDLNSLRDFASDGLTNTSESNNPKHTAGLWAKYKFKNNNFLRNFDIGFGGNYVSESKLFDDSINAVNEFISIPDYVVVNQRIGYRYKNIDASLNINNILDDRYFTGGVDAGRVFPGAPRNFLLTVGYQF